MSDDVTAPAPTVGSCASGGTAETRRRTMTVAEEVAVRRIRTGIDTGGTFTDVVALEEGFGGELYPDQTFDEAKEP